MTTAIQYKNRLTITVLLSTVLIGAVYALWYVMNSDTQTMTVSGISMMPTLKPGEEVSVSKTIDPGDLKAGDLVAVSFQTRERKMLKRVIAVADDEVQFIDGRLKINGQWLSTAWWPESKRLEPRHYKLLVLQLSRYDNHIPKNNLIIMGDNTDKSFDSGDFGMVSMDQITGVVTVKKWH